MPPAPPTVPPSAPAGLVHPDDVLPLDAPTQRPNEPVTTGIDQAQPVPANVQAMLKHLPYLEAARVNSPDETPASIINLINYLQGHVT